MSYEVGTRIDLRHLNKKPGGSAPIEKKSNFQEAINNAYDVGTQIVFKFNKESVQVARRIPVVYA